MADIDVVPKRGTKLWLWLLLAVAVIVILWMVFGRQPSRLSGQLNDLDGSHVHARILMPFTGDNT